VAIRDHTTRLMTVYRVAITTTDTGGQTRTQSAVATDVPCHLQPQLRVEGQRVETRAQRHTMLSDHDAYTETEVDVRPNDRVSIAPGCYAATETFTVIGAMNVAGKDRLYVLWLRKETI
jgi:hypothetical protein